MNWFPPHPFRLLWCYFFHRRYWTRTGFRQYKVLTFTDYWCEKCWCEHDGIASGWRRY